jgi:hypothetical protein
MQITDTVPPVDLFSDYIYFSSFSDAMLRHARAAVQQHIAGKKLGKDSFVIEIASNDGYLLKNFVEAGIPCLGFEPAANIAEVARKNGVETHCEFFGQATAAALRGQKGQADLILGNNVFAHVPNINDFTRGLKAALKPSGTVTLEFPHLLRLIESAQFDTIYHEHFSYLSLQAVSRIFSAAGLAVCDVEELPTHGGSLRIYGCHADCAIQPSEAVARILGEERKHGLLDLKTYTAFQSRAEKIKDDFLSFLIEQKRAGKKVAAYGAAAKGNTLLNFAGVKPDLLPFVCDAAPSKQGKFLPGSHIPIHSPEKLAAEAPDFVLILPWNIADEVIAHSEFLHARGTKFLTAVPNLNIL